MSAALDVGPLLAEFRETGRWRSLARAISLVENAQPWDVEIPAAPKPVHCIGVTGPPGTGKSTLVGGLIESYAETGKRVGVRRRRPVEPDQRRRRARRPGAHGAAARARGRLRQEPREPRRDGRARRRDAKRRTRARELWLLRRDPDRDGGRRSDRDRDREPRRHRARRHGSRPRRCGAGDQGRRARGGRVRGREHGRPPGSRRDRTTFPARAGQGDARAADGGNRGNRRARAARQARRALRAAAGGRDAHNPAPAASAIGGGAARPGMDRVVREQRRRRRGRIGARRGGTTTRGGSCRMASTRARHGHEDAIAQDAERWRRERLPSALERVPLRRESFTTLSGIPIKDLYTPDDVRELDYRPISASRASTPTRAAPTRACTAAARGRSARWPASARARTRTAATSTCSPTARRGSRRTSTCRPCSATTPTTPCSCARWARPASRSTRSRTRTRCSRASRSTRCRRR